MKLRHILLGIVLIMVGVAIFIQEYLTFGTFVLSDFNPLTGLHHEWVGTLFIISGILVMVI